jgi:enoyl-CoA hydratase/carnithine racemase
MSTVGLTCVDPGVLQITLPRPEALNALNYAMVLDFLAVLDEVESDSDCRTVILAGAGRAFCAGFDLRGYGDEERIASQGKTPPRTSPRPHCPFWRSVPRITRTADGPLSAWGRARSERRAASRRRLSGRRSRSGRAR